MTKKLKQHFANGVSKKPPKGKKIFPVALVDANILINGSRFILNSLELFESNGVLDLTINGVGQAISVAESIVLVIDLFDLFRYLKANRGGE